MAWVTVAVAGAGLVSTFLGNKKAKKGEKRQREMQEKQLALDKERLDWSKQTYADWQEKFDPMYSQMVANIDQDITPNYGMIAGDVKSAYQSAREANERNLMRYGASPLDGNMQAMNRDYGIREAGTHVGVRAQAREASKGVLWNRQAKVAGMLGSMQSAPMQNVNAGYNAEGNTLGAMGDTARDQGIAAQGRWDNWGNQAGQIGSLDWKGLASGVRSNASPIGAGTGLGPWGTDDPSAYYHE